LFSTVCEMPAAAASRRISDRKVLKSPPHVAALTGAATNRVQNKMASDRNSKLLLIVPLQAIMTRQTMQNVRAIG
jgi:hypothetical protein